MFIKAPHSFDQLYEQQYPLVRRLIYNMTGQEALDDLTQEAFLKIWKGLPSFGFQSSIRTWVYRITLNTVFDYLRRNRIEAVSEIENIADSNNDQIEYSELIQRNLFKLKEEQRAIILLYYFEERKIAEIGKILKIPSGTVKSRLHHAKQKLGELLKREGVNYES